MRKAFGLLELLIVLVIGIIIYFMCIQPNYGNKNPFDDRARVNTQKEIINDKIQDIEKTQEIKRQIEQNLGEGL